MNTETVHLKGEVQTLQSEFAGVAKSRMDLDRERQEKRDEDTRVYTPLEEEKSDAHFNAVMAKVDRLLCRA